MTVRERILSVYRNEMPDQIPISIYRAYVREGTVQREARNKGLGILYTVQCVSLLSPPDHLREESFSKINNASFSVGYKWINGELIEIHRIETPVGIVTQHKATDPSYGSKWIRKYYIENREDYKTVQYIVENTVFRSRANNTAQSKRDLGDDGVILSRIDRSPYQKMLLELVKPEKFLIDLYIDPEPGIELMEVIGNRVFEQFSMALESDADVMWLTDNVTSDMTPPDVFAKYCMPFYEKCYSACRETGKPVLIHLDGRLSALKNLIAQSTFDVIDSFTLPEINGDVPIPEAISAWPDKVICPNFPSSFSTKSKKEIEALLDRIFSEFGEKKPFMIQISEDIPLESYDHLLPILSSFFNTRGKRG